MPNILHQFGHPNSWDLSDESEILQHPNKNNYENNDVKQALNPACHRDVHVYQPHQKADHDQNERCVEQGHSVGSVIFSVFFRIN
jgi:hypothetical protein